MMNDPTKKARKDERAARREALLRNVLERVGDKWTLLVIEELGSAGELRFTQLRDRVGQVSQKMLTQTLRALERDGLVSRTVHPVVPPRVDYRLTARGEALELELARGADGRPLLMELEIVEPSLFLDRAPEQAALLVDAVLA